MASLGSHWLSSYACGGLRKGGFPLLLANTWMRAHMCMRLSTRRVGVFNGIIALTLSTTKRPVSSDGDEVSDKFFHYIPSSNLHFCGYEVIVV